MFMYVCVCVYFMHEEGVLAGFSGAGGYTTAPWWGLPAPTAVGSQGGHVMEGQRGGGQLSGGLASHWRTHGPYRGGAGQGTCKA